jgi:hypothetical protein
VLIANASRKTTLNAASKVARHKNEIDNIPDIAKYHLKVVQNGSPDFEASLDCRPLE